jgi:hypothetical protein
MPHCSNVWLEYFHMSTYTPSLSFYWANFWRHNCS